MISATDGIAMPKTTRKPASKSSLETKTIGIRGRTDWVEWLEQGAEFCRIDVAKLVDLSAIEYLKARGFKKQAPSRL
jgi:hypothetical protein